jgi:hypothetical protein
LPRHKPLLQEPQASTIPLPRHKLPLLLLHDTKTTLNITLF